jgi:hypothetical protein
VRSGQLGKISFVRTWTYSNRKRKASAIRRMARPVAPASTGKCGSDPRRACVQTPTALESIRTLSRTSAGSGTTPEGMMTDWGHPPARHRADGVRREPRPTAVTALGSKLFIKGQSRHAWTRCR